LNNSPTAEKSDEQIDYFSDIAATVKKTPKVIHKHIKISHNFLNLNI